MRFYHVSDGRTSGQPSYYATLVEAHKAAKEFFDRFEVTIEAVDVPSDKDNILRLLNGLGGHEERQDQPEAWELTKRGGLKRTAGA